MTQWCIVGATASILPRLWYEGVRTVVLPSVNTKALDTITATFLALLDVVANDRADIIHVHGIGNAVLFPLFRLFGKRVVTAVDGMDWTRAKWNRAERAYCVSRSTLR